LNDFDDEKSRISEISEEIMVDSTIEKSTRSKSLSYLNNNLESESTETSSSTDTQILLLNRTPRNQTSTKNELEANNDKDQYIDNNTDTENIESETTLSIGTKAKLENGKQNNRIVDSIEDSFLNETISQMIKIREEKIKKLGKASSETYINDIFNEDLKNEDKASNNLKIYIPSINLDEDIEEPDSTKHTLYSSHRVNELKEKINKLKVPYKREQIEKLTDIAFNDFFWKRIENNQYFSFVDLDFELLLDNRDLADYFQSNLDAEIYNNKGENNSQIEINFKRMLLDLIGELSSDLYLEKYEQPKSVSKFFPGVIMNVKKKNFKSVIRGPFEQVEAQKLIKKKVNQLLKLSYNNESFLNTKSEIKAKSKWRSQKKLDLVDNLLDGEMREQEHEWSNYELEEYEAKTLISNTIFDIILMDTVECFQSNIIKKMKN